MANVITSYRALRVIAIKYLEHPRTIGCSSIIDIVTCTVVRLNSWGKSDCRSPRFPLGICIYGKAVTLESSGHIKLVLFIMIKFTPNTVTLFPLGASRTQISSVSSLMSRLRLHFKMVSLHSFTSWLSIKILYEDLGEH
jgi:hypothetical protein